MPAYRYHSIEPEGVWTSEPFPSAERRHIVQGVIAGFLSGHPRWATDMEGNFIYGLDAKGKEMKSAPRSHSTKKARSTKKEKRLHFAGYDFTSGPEGTVVHRPTPTLPGFQPDDRVQYRDVNLWQQGTVTGADGKWIMVRWDGNSFVSREWAPNLRHVSAHTAHATRSSASRHHATKKSAAQLDREIAEALGQFPFDEPELKAKWVVQPSDLRVGQRFDYFGKPYEITKIGRDKAKTVQIARRYKDPFGKEELIEHRSFPMRAFYQQHLRPLR
ncbi:MAG: hypothetical protein ACM37U_12610 [Gemmatimonas sp.]